MIMRKGQELTEWAIIIALVSVVCMATLFMFAPRMVKVLEYVTNSINSVNQTN
jgi:hypothetical protein